MIFAAGITSILIGQSLAAETWWHGTFAAEGTLRIQCAARNDTFIGFDAATAEWWEMSCDITGTTELPVMRAVVVDIECLETDDDPQYNYSVLLLDSDGDLITYPPLQRYVPCFE